MRLLVYLAMCGTAFAQSGRRSTPPATVPITIDDEGDLDIQDLTIRENDFVKWVSMEPTDSIVQVPTVGAGVDPCTLAEPHGDDAFEFTGPDRRGVPGLWIRGPNNLQQALEEIPFTGAETCDCEPSCGFIEADDWKLCPGQSGVQYIMDISWTPDWVAGGLVVLDWDQVETASDVYDWTILDHELNNAVDNGKSLKIAIVAGTGTPSWVFDTAYEVVVKDDNDSNPGASGDCGTDFSVGSPSDDVYRAIFNDLMTDMATHVKTDDAWYNALTVITMGGLNNVTDEMKLPKACCDGDCNEQGGPVQPDGRLDGTFGGLFTDECICNTKVWAEAGYTPDELYEYYNVHTAAIQAAFPDKDMSLMLIQSGWPRVIAGSPPNFIGDHLLDTDGVTPLLVGGTGADNGAIPGAADQLEEIIADCQGTWGNLCIVAHNGLRAYPTDIGQVGNCNQEAEITGSNPWSAVFPLVQSPRGDDPSSCPNKWAVLAGRGNAEHGPYFQGMQTNNETNGIDDPESLESTLVNAVLNTNSIYVEAYEKRLWELLRVTGGGDVDIDPTRTPPLTSKTPNEWAAEFQERREFFDSTEGPAFPTTYNVQFTEPGTYYYYNPRRCGAGKHGKITVQ
jgi:hypothetical protein